MILPHPESDLTTNIMVVGADIIKQFKKKKALIPINILLEDFLKKDIKRTPELFDNALTFLYTCGLIEQEDDQIRKSLPPTLFPC